MKKTLALIIALAMVLGTMSGIAFAKETADVWDGTIDTSWYNETDTEFTITTAEQWAGLAYLVNGAKSYSPADDVSSPADFGYYTDGHKSARPDESATAKSISFEGKTIYLAADLDLCAVDAAGNPVKLPGNEQLSMMPVGYSKYTPFKGTFDAQGHTIKNLFQGGWDLYGLNYKNVYLGLFGCVENATIKNLVIDNFSFNCEMNLGAVAGRSGGTSTFDGITIRNSTIATGGGWWVGGLIGWAYGNQTIKNIDIDETNTVAQVGGNYDTAVGGIIGGCDNVDGESIAFINCEIACKLDVFNDCTANYNSGVYRNCGMVIGGIGESNEVIIDGVKYPDLKSKGITFNNVNVHFGDWADYEYCWSYSLPKNCQRVQPGVGYAGVDVSSIADASVEVIPFNAIVGAENAGDLSNVRGAVDEKVMAFLVEKELLPEKSEVVNVTDARYAAAIGWDKYHTIEDAIADADDGDEIKIYAGTYPAFTVPADKNNLTFVGETGAVGRSRAVKNLVTIETLAADTNTHNGGVFVQAETTTFKNLDFVSGDVAGRASTWMSSAIGNTNGDTGARSNLKNLTIDGCNFMGSGTLQAVWTNQGNITVTNSTITNYATGIDNYGIGADQELVIEKSVITDVANAFHTGEAVAGSKINVTETTIDSDKIDVGGAVKVNVTKSKIENATVTAYANVEMTISESELYDTNYAIDGGNATIDISGNYANNINDLVELAKAENITFDSYYLTKDELNDSNKQPNDVNIAEAITVAFVEDSVAEGELVYDINLTAPGKVINRLNSVDLTFVQSNDKIAFEIIASNPEVAINPVDNSTTRYEFHYNGKGEDVDSDTAETITIGQVKFVGYGKFTFAVDTSATTNVAHATKIADNIVDTFIPDGNTAVISDGELVIDNATTGEIEIAVPTRKLTINVAFPNAVEKKDEAYQDMTVTVSGGDLAKTIEVELGAVAKEVDIATEYEKENAKYTVAVADGYVVTIDGVLTVNTAYTVTVSGAGYRTARYTVTMTEPKTLNFWNNVMDEVKEVEIGKESSEVTKNFLAGDIVKDNDINIYDLSAVVSYFASESTTANGYAKYDLNRDGMIDSKDVAYVLVSWNN